MLTDVMIDYNPEVITNAIIAIVIFIIGLLALLVTFIIVKKKNPTVSLENNTNEKIDRLYFLYQNNEITEAELEKALEKLSVEGRYNEKNN